MVPALEARGIEVERRREEALGDAQDVSYRHKVRRAGADKTLALGQQVDIGERLQCQRLALASTSCACPCRYGICLVADALLGQPTSIRHHHPQRIQRRVCATVAGVELRDDGGGVCCCKDNLSRDQGGDLAYGCYVSRDGVDTLLPRCVLRVSPTHVHSNCTSASPPTPPAPKPHRLLVEVV